MLSLPFSLPMPPASRVQQVSLGLVKFARWTPKALQQQVAQRLLNQIFAESIEDGDLDFLEDKFLRMEITDAQFAMSLTVIAVEDRLRIRCLDVNSPDAVIRGNLASFVKLSAKTVDADTLFFQRKLVMEGDTAVALEFKNLTDAFDLDQLPKSLREGLQWLAQQHDTDTLAN
jgi:predicted lipid carrier protein YhbT